MVKNNSVDKESILITGCSSGIGRATAIYLAKKGMTVFATVRKEEDAETLRRVSLPTLIPLCPVDLTHPDQIFRAVDRMREELDRRGSTGLDGLLHNAGGEALLRLKCWISMNFTPSSKHVWSVRSL